MIKVIIKDRILKKAKYKYNLTNSYFYLKELSNGIEAISHNAVFRLNHENENESQSHSELYIIQFISDN